MILPRTTVRAAYERALALQPDHDAAVLAAAQALLDDEKRRVSPELF